MSQSFIGGVFSWLMRISLLHFNCCNTLKPDTSNNKIMLNLNNVTFNQIFFTTDFFQIQTFFNLKKMCNPNAS